MTHPPAPTSAIGDPTGLDLRLRRAARELFTLRIPLGGFDASRSDGSDLPPTAEATDGLPDPDAGQVPIVDSTTAAPVKGGFQVAQLHPFATVDLRVARAGPDTTGPVSIEARRVTPSGTSRLLVSYRRAAGTVRVDHVSSGTVHAVADFPAPVVPSDFTLRAQFAGRSITVWLVTAAASTPVGRADLMASTAPLDLRAPSELGRWTVGCSAASEDASDSSIVISGFSTFLSGNGHADPRIASHEDGSPLQEGDTVWVLMTTRGTDISDAYQGVYALDTATGALSMTGAIFCDRGDGVLRNENAGHLFLDRRTGRWNYLGIGHSDHPAPRHDWLGSSDRDLRFGVSTVPVTQVDLGGTDELVEDLYPTWDPDLDRWVAVASRNASRTVRLESADPIGPWSEVAAVGSDETGELIVRYGRRRFIVAGTADTRFVVRDYETGTEIGHLALDRDTGGNRVWPVLFPVRLPDGTDRWHLLSFDRDSPSGRYSYGGLYFYDAL